jgi:hypothetical protein
MKTYKKALTSILSVLICTNAQSAMLANINQEKLEKNIVHAKYSASSSDFDCDDLEDIVEEVDGQLDAKSLRLHSFEVEIKLLKNISNNRIYTNAKSESFAPGKILLGEIEPQFEWNRSAISIQAKNDVAFKAEEIIRKKLKDLEVIDTLAKTGSVRIKSDLSPLYCDLQNEDLKLSINFELLYYESRRIPSPISSKTIGLVNSEARKLESKFLKSSPSLSYQDQRVMAGIALGAAMNDSKVFNSGMSSEKILNFIDENIDDYSGKLRVFTEKENKSLEDFLGTTVNSEKNMKISTKFLEKE